tara:strand:- start:6611 stop:7183 length:573 start_codon:yes stop_codon:yes gene_type:complete
MIEQSNVGGQNNNDIQVHGLKELDTLIKSLQKGINQDNVWRSVWKKVGKPALMEAQSKAPVSDKKIPYPPSVKKRLFRDNKVGKYIMPGTLKNSIGFFRTPSSKDYNGIYLGPRVKGRFKKEKGGYFGAWVEYGSDIKFFGKHFGKKDQPFMRDAFENNKVQMLTNTFKHGQKIVDQYIKRYVKRTSTFK